MSEKAYPFLYQINIDQDVRRRLSYSLDLVVKGNNEVYTTPLGKDGNADKILSKLDKVFKDNNSKLINSTLQKMEEQNRDKFGPRSIAIPWSERKESLLDSFRYENKSAKDLKIRLSNKVALRPISLETAISKLKNDTNSGLPYYTRKSKVKDKIFDEFDELMKENYPCILFTRTQESKKTRNVWGYPIDKTTNEMKFYSPLLEYQRKYASYRSALLGPEQVCRSLTEIIKHAVRNKRDIVSIDFSAYDNSVNPQLQQRAFEFIQELFQKKYHPEINELYLTFNRIGIITPDGILSGPHGVPSGSTFTNEVDSIVQFLISSNSTYVDQDFIQIQGDDGVYCVSSGNANKLFKEFESHGLEVNEDKSYVSQDYAIYLQNLFHMDYYDKDKDLIGGIYPLYRALNRICYQERWTDFEDYGLKGKDYYAIRTLCILENCKHHPLFEEFVKLIYQEDKYSLEFSEQGLKSYLHMMNQTQGLGGIIINQHGDDARGIKAFESYKIINKLG